MMNETFKMIIFPFLVFFACISFLNAETPTAIKLTTGKAAFLDEDIPFDHSLFRGSATFYLTKRLALQPEFTFMHGPNSHQDYLFVSNVQYDLIGFGRNRLYILGGGGLLYQRERFPGALDPDFSTTEWTAGGGIGLNLFLSKRIFMAPEFRFGWEPLLQYTVGIGYKF